MPVFELTRCLTSVILCEESRAGKGTFISEKRTIKWKIENMVDRIRGYFDASSGRRPSTQELTVETVEASVEFGKGVSKE